MNSLDDLERLARGAREALFDGADWAATMGSHDDVALHNAAWSPDRALAFIALAKCVQAFVRAKNRWQGAHLAEQDEAFRRDIVRAEDALRACLAAVTGPAAGGEK